MEAGPTTVRASDRLDATRERMTSRGGSSLIDSCQTMPRRPDPSTCVICARRALALLPTR